MNLVELKFPPWDDMIAELEKLLEQAKSGELRGIAMGVEFSDGASWMVMRGKDCSACRLIGGLELAKAELVEMLK